MARAIVTSKGQVTIPKNIREKSAIKKGTQLDFQCKGDLIIIRPVKKDISSLKGIVKHKRKKPVFLQEMNAAIKKRPRE